MPETKQVFATGAEISRIVDKFEATIDFTQDNPIHVLMACLSIALMLAKPDLTARELQAGLNGVSGWISAFALQREAQDPTETLTATTSDTVN